MTAWLGFSGLALSIWAVSLFLLFVTRFMERRALVSAQLDTASPSLSSTAPLLFKGTRTIPSRAHRVLYLATPMGALVAIASGLLALPLLGRSALQGEGSLFFVIAGLTSSLIFEIVAGWSANDRLGLMGSLRVGMRVTAAFPVLLIGLATFVLQGQASDLALLSEDAGATTWLGLPNWGLFRLPLASMAVLMALAALVNECPFADVEARDQADPLRAHRGFALGLLILARRARRLAAQIFVVLVVFGGAALPWEKVWSDGFSSVAFGAMVIIAKVLLLSFGLTRLRIARPRWNAREGESVLLTWGLGLALLQWIFVLIIGTSAAQ